MQHEAATYRPHKHSRQRTPAASPARTPLSDSVRTSSVWYVSYIHDIRFINNRKTTLSNGEEKKESYSI